MSDSERWYTIPQSTFGPYFSVSHGTPGVAGLGHNQAGVGNTQCGINYYELLDHNDPYVKWPASRAAVTWSGSFGSHEIKIDKRQFASEKPFFIRAMTKGLVVADQHMMVTICPPDGGAFITAPTEETIYATIIRGATGNGTLVSFEAWTISDIFRGCGKFEKYSLSPAPSSYATIACTGTCPAT
jgi:hypothetical protein